MASDSTGWPHLVTLAGVSAQGFSAHDWVLLIALFCTLVIAAMAAAAETALTSISRIRIRNLAEEGDAQARRIERLLQQPQVFLSTILVISNLAVITGSTFATLIAVDLDFPAAEVVMTTALALVVLIFCEITPKSAAVQAPERWARWLVGPVEFVAIVLKPVVRTLTWTTAGIVRLFGATSARRGPFVTEDELRLLVEVSEEEGVLEEEEREMIDNVFELSDTSVREVMVPRIDMVTVEIDDSIESATNVILQGGQSRIPVYDTSIDNIVGVLYAKDLLRVLAGNARPATVRQLPLRAAYFVPESKRLDDLLRELQKQRVHMAIVVDEYGAVAGLVTIEDLVEEIIGDVLDEYDVEEQLVEQTGENTFVIDAKISLDEFNEIVERKLPEDGYETLGGFVYARLDKIPTVGDMVRYQDVAITVLSTKGRRVTKVQVVRGLTEEEQHDVDQQHNDSEHDATEGRDRRDVSGDHSQPNLQVLRSGDGPLAPTA